MGEGEPWDVPHPVKSSGDRAVTGIGKRLHFGNKTGKRLDGGKIYGILTTVKAKHVFYKIIFWRKKNMKKIVALVLSLVMALSLATVAFAAVKDQDVFYDKQTAGEAHEYTYYAATSYKAGADNKLAYLVDNATKKCYFVGDKTGTTLYAAGGEVAEITLGDEFTDWDDVTYQATAEAVKASDWSCTSDKYDAGYKLVWSDGKTYYAEDAEDNEAGYNVLVNGEIKHVKDQKVMKGQHILCVPTSGEKEVGVGVYEGYCAACKETIKYAKTKVNGAGALYTNDTEFAKTLLEKGDVSVKVGYKVYEGSWYLVGKTDTKPADGVTSAKTFDAGVAMYVGMSLLSVAGGAVVIGKKKEF